MELKMIHAEDIHGYIRQKDAVLVDLRSTEDYRAFHIRGAINIPEPQLSRFMRRADKGRQYVFCCQHGSLSIREGVRYLRQGYCVCSLAGGIEAYLNRRDR